MRNTNNITYLHGPPPRPRPPTVEVQRIRDRRGDLLVIESCPHCGDRHVHGAAGKADCGDHGHRLGHCWKPEALAHISTGYRLYEPCPPARAAKAKTKTVRAPRPTVKRALRDFRREGDPHVRATLFRRLLRGVGFIHGEIDVVIEQGFAALERSRTGRSA
jgi:hypothetical protein